jgi:hypothetical protein
MASILLNRGIHELRGILKYVFPFRVFRVFRGILQFGSGYARIESLGILRISQILVDGIRSSG